MNGTIGLKCEIFKDNNLEQMAVEINAFMAEKRIHQVTQSDDSYGNTVITVWYID